MNTVTTAPEAWRNFQPGDRLVLTRPISDTEKELIGQGHTFTFIEYTRPHGYARCRNGEYGTWLLHPEALEEASLRNRIVGLLARHLRRDICLERANNITQVMVLEPETSLDRVAREMLRNHEVPEAVLQAIGRLPLDE